MALSQVILKVRFFMVFYLRSKMRKKKLKSDWNGKEVSFGAGDYAKRHNLLFFNGGRYWVRTSDILLVREFNSL
jgi:hypothetical protein